MPDVLRWFLIEVPYADKIGHIVLYGALAWFLGVLLQKLSLRWAWIVGPTLSWGIGFLDEVRQIGLRGRDAGFSDLLANTIGVLVAAWLVRRRHQDTEYRLEGDPRLPA